MTGMEKQIQRVFNSTVDTMMISADLKTAAKNHPARKIMFENLNKQLMDVRALRLKEGKGPLLDSTVDWFIAEMTQMYVNQVKAVFELKAKSDAEKTRLKREADDKADIDATIAGTPQGDYADIVQAIGDGDAALKLDS